MINKMILAAMGIGALSAGALAGGGFYDESFFGGDYGPAGAPTFLLLAPGPTDVHGNVGGSDIQDFVRITVPAGFQLTGYTHYLYHSADLQGFTGVQAGTSFAGSPFVAGSYMGYAHYGDNATNPPLPAGSTVGVNLLPIMANPAVSAGATGMPSILPAGNYTFLIQQLGGATEYGFTFTMAPVPTPSAAGVLGLGALGLMRRGRR